MAVSCVQHSVVSCKCLFKNMQYKVLLSHVVLNEQMSAAFNSFHMKLATSGKLYLRYFLFPYR